MVVIWVLILLFILILITRMMVIMVIFIISLTPQAQWKEECHKLRWLKEQYLLLYYQVEIFTVDHFLRQ